MERSLLVLMVLSLFLGAGCWFFFIWGVKRGEFDDVERSKYRMLDDDPHLTLPPPDPPDSQERGRGDRD